MEPVIGIYPYIRHGELDEVQQTLAYITIGKLLSLLNGEEILMQLQKNKLFSKSLGKDYGILFHLVTEQEAIEVLIEKGMRLDNLDSLIRGI